MRKRIFCLLIAALLCLSLLPATATADGLPVYTVILKAGYEGQNDIVIRSDDEGRMAADVHSAANGQFWIENGDEVWFKIPDCPFTPEDGYRFSKWSGNLTPGTIWQMSDTQMTLTASWEILSADYSLSVPGNAVLNGAGTTNIPFELTKLILGKYTYDDGHLRYTVQVYGLYLSLDSGSLEDGRGHSIPFSGSSSHLRQAGTGNLQVYIDPNDYDSAPPGIYRGTVRYHQWWVHEEVNMNDRTEIGSGTISLTVLGPDTDECQVTLEKSPAEGGIVSGAGTYYETETATVTAAANNGYIFVNWTENGAVVSTDAAYSFTVTSDRTLTANFEPFDGRTVTLSPGAGGGSPILFSTATSVIAENRQSAANCQFYRTDDGIGFRLDTDYIPDTFTRPAGKVLFNGWGTNDAYNLLTMTNTVYTIQWQQVDYLVTVTTDGHGTAHASPEGGSRGTHVTISAVPDEGYVFDHWELISGRAFFGSITDSSYGIRLSISDENIKAHFKPIDYTLTAGVSPSNGGTVSGVGTYHYNDQVTVTAVPSEGYRFVRWDGTDGLDFLAGDSLTPSVTFSMPTRSVSLTAAFLDVNAVPEISGHKLLLSGEIGVQFKVVLPENFDASGSSMHFSVSDGRTGAMQFSDAVQDSSNANAWWFTCYINALELKDIITAEYRYGADQTVTDNYSAMTYIFTAKALYGENQDLIRLLDALQNYGAYLQNSGWTDGANHASVDKVTWLYASDIEVARAGTNGMAIVKTAEGSGISADNILFALTLNSQTRINVYVKSDGAAFSSVTGAVPNGTRTIGGEPYLRFDTAQISAGNLGNAYTVTVVTDSGTATVTASAMSYVYAVLEGAFTEEKQYAMTAFYYYHTAAKACMS